MKHPIIFYNHFTNWADSWSSFRKKAKKIQQHNPHKFVQKNHLAQAMGPIVFYTHAKKLERSFGRFGEKANKEKKTHTILDN